MNCGGIAVRNSGILAYKCRMASSEEFNLKGDMRGKTVRQEIGMQEIAPKPYLARLPADF
jgi:hypothetical protein